MRASFPSLRLRVAALGLALGAALLLGACSSAGKRPDPTPLLPDPHRLSVKEAWHADIGRVDLPLVLRVSGTTVGVAGSAGAVALLDGRTGEQIWRADLGEDLIAALGHDGRSAAVVTVSNDLVVLAEGKVLWRQHLTSPTYTPPLVAGGRVFVLAADRSVQAFDGQSGRRIWNQSRTGEPLVLSQPGVLMPVGDTLVAGIGARLVGFNPLNGASRWELPLSSPRGTNDVERLVDLVDGVSRQGNELCLRAFQSVVGCVDAGQGRLLWTKPANSGTGVAGDASTVFGTEADGTVVAWRRKDGERLWALKALRFHALGTPALVGPTLVIGDAQGLLHFLSRDDGALLARYETDGSPIVSTPVFVGNTLVVVTRAGRVLGLKPQQGS